MNADSRATLPITAGNKFIIRHVVKVPIELVQDKNLGHVRGLSLVHEFTRERTGVTEGERTISATF